MRHILVFAGLLGIGSVGVALLTSACASAPIRRPHAPGLRVDAPSFVAVPIRPRDGAPYDLFVGVTEVTQAQYRTVMGASPSFFEGCDTCPVEMVSVYDAMAFANAMSAREGHTPCYTLEGCTSAPEVARRWRDQSHAAGLDCARVVSIGPTCDGYRLPSRAEWSVIGPVPEAMESHRAAHRYAVHDERPSTGYGPDPVATLRPSHLGLYDTLGNVDEWLDAETTAPTSLSRRRRDDADATWFETAASCFGTRTRALQSDRRQSEIGAFGRSCLGFRVVRTAPPSTPATPPAPPAP